MSGAMRTSLIDDFTEISDRLYCCSQALLHGDGTAQDHSVRIGSEIEATWRWLEDILIHEKHEIIRGSGKTIPFESIEEPK